MIYMEYICYTVLFNIDLNDKIPEKKGDKSKTTEYKSLTMTSKIMKSTYKPIPPSYKLVSLLSKKGSNNSNVKEVKKEAECSVNNYAPSDITLFRKPVLDHMYDLWSHEFVKASNARHLSEKDFDISFAYVNVLMKEDIGVSANEEEKMELKKYTWGIKKKNNAKYEKEISKVERGKGEYFTLTVEKELNGSPEEISHLQRVLCLLYPEKSSLERLDTVNPCK